MPAKVRFLAPPRTHAVGHFRVLVTVRSRAPESAGWDGFKAANETDCAS